jgi:hypothetical protein
MVAMHDIRGDWKTTSQDELLPYVVGSSCILKGAYTVVPLPFRQFVAE